jgi:hypothetical protein
VYTQCMLCSNVCVHTLQYLYTRSTAVYTAVDLEVQLYRGFKRKGGSLLGYKIITAPSIHS